MNSDQHLLLLPGMMCDQRLWAAQLDSLRAECASVHVGNITRGDSIEEIANQVLEDAPKHFALAGLSMGGLVAFEMWRQAPERIHRMALLDANANPETEERRQPREELLNRVLQGELKEVFIEALKPQYLARANCDNRAILELVMSMAMDLGKDVFVRQSTAVGSRPDSIDTLKTISVPTLVLCGEEDALCPVPFHETMAEHIPNARLAVLENCGHLSSLEQPERVTTELKKWLKTA